MSYTKQAEDWLDNEDDVCRQDRLERLQWLAVNMPDHDLMLFWGGAKAQYLFEEARYCFVYGQFLATILLGLAYVEGTLASMFYASGRNELQRAPIPVFLDEALKSGWLSKAECNHIRQAQKVRNSVANFRQPGDVQGDPPSLEVRAITQNTMPNEIIEQDARYVMEVVFRLLASVSP